MNKPMKTHTIKSASDTWKSLPEGQRARTLAATYFVPQKLSIESPAAPEDAEYKRKAVDAVASSQAAADFCPQWQNFLQSLNPEQRRRFSASPQGHLLLNLSGSITENAGLAMEYICGVPVIPGSAVKGAARRYAVELLKETHDAAAHRKLLEDFLAIFGCVKADFEQTGQLKRLLTEEECREIKPCNRIGLVSFLQAVPETNPTVTCEVQTPHHGKYMASTDPKAKATDDELPVPLFFPAVEAGKCAYSFCLYSPARPDLLETAEEWLTQALTLFGIGAKGTSGFGIFRMNEPRPCPTSTLRCAAPLFSTRMVLITPCYCAGAYQNRPELRATSFRGELRWWFRCLGGSKEQENRIFGSISGKSACRSGISLSLSKHHDGETSYRYPFEKGGNKNAPKNSAYLTYALTMKKGKQTKERKDDYLRPGLEFTLTLRQLMRFSTEEEKLLKLAWECLCNLGSVGLRSTRAFGAYAPADPGARCAEKLLAEPTVAKAFKSLVLPHNYGDYLRPVATQKMLTECAARLAEYRRRYGLRADGGDKWKRSRRAFYGPSSLGNAAKVRQKSAVRFRPVLTADNRLLLCILKAPGFTLGYLAQSHDIPKL